MEIWFCVDKVPDKWTEKGVGARLCSTHCRPLRFSEIEGRGLNNGCSWNKR